MSKSKRVVKLGICPRPTGARWTNSAALPTLHEISKNQQIIPKGNNSLHVLPFLAEPLPPQQILESALKNRENQIGACRCKAVPRKAGNVQMPKKAKVLANKARSQGGNGFLKGNMVMIWIW